MPDQDRTKPIKYPFAGANEENGYRLFTDELENSDLVAFHGTAETNLLSIIDNGFRIEPPFPSTSYARNSSHALKYACEKRSGNSPNGCVLIVRFRSLQNVTVESGVIHVYRQEFQPELIGYCVIPASYDFV